MRNTLVFLFTAFLFTACAPTPEQIEDFEVSKKFIIGNERYLYVDGPAMQKHNDSVKILIDELRENDLIAITKKHKLDKDGVDSYLLALSASVNLVKARKALEEGLKIHMDDLDSFRRHLDSVMKADTFERFYPPPGKVDSL